MGFISSSAALFSPIVKGQYCETFPNVMVTDAIEHALRAPSPPREVSAAL